MAYKRRGRSKIFLTHFLIMLSLLLLTSEMGFEDISPLILLGYYPIYRLFKGFDRKRLNGVQERIDLLKDHIHQADIKHKKLEQLMTNGDFLQFKPLAHEVLQAISTIQYELKSLKTHIDPNIYQRVHHKALEIETSVTTDLQSLDYKPDTSNNNTDNFNSHSIEKIPAEIRETYLNILKDHDEILKKIALADNKAELEAIHESNMQRFRDILDGYLEIKRSPKNFYKADERLAKAKLALEKFDTNLDETLKQLNESNLKDFDVSLRMINDDL